MGGSVQGGVEEGQHAWTGGDVVEGEWDSVQGSLEGGGATWQGAAVAGGGGEGGAV